jgi:hypothetical protein
MRKVILAAFFLAASLASVGMAEAVSVYYFIVFPSTGAQWGPLRFDFFNLNQCNAARTKAIQAYTATAVWSDGQANCVTEAQP